MGLRICALALALLLYATSAWGETRVRCEITLVGGFWMARLHVENQTSTPVTYELTAVLGGGDEEWRSKPVAGSLDAGADAEHSFRPFAKGRAIDRCSAEIGGKRVGETHDSPAPLPPLRPLRLGDVDVYFETSHRFGRWFGIQGPYVADGILVGVGAEIGIVSDFGRWRRVRAGGGLSVAGFGIDITENDMWMLRLQPRVRVLQQRSRHVTLQPGIGVADHGAKVLSMSAGYGASWYRLDAEVMGVLGSGSELNESAWAASVGFSLSGPRAVIPPAVEVVAALVITAIGLSGSH